MSFKQAVYDSSLGYKCIVSRIFLIIIVLAKHQK